LSGVVQNFHRFSARHIGFIRFFLKKLEIKDLTTKTL